MTLEEIIIIEPKIKSVLIMARKMQTSTENYYYLKRLLTPLVGIDAAKEQLRSSRCYEIVHGALVKKLRY